MASVYSGAGRPKKRIWGDKFQMSFEWETEKYECSPVYFRGIFRDLGCRDNGYQPSLPQYPLYSVVPSVHEATYGQLWQGQMC